MEPRQILKTIQILLLLSLYVQIRHAYQSGKRTPTLKPYNEFLGGPVVKSLRRPVLTVTDPLTQSRIHLVGVCHGSASSANLVREIFKEVNPAAVVLELCDDRFFSISLEAKIRPRGNDTMIKCFDDELAIMKNDELKAEDKTGIIGAFTQLNMLIGFVGQQGLIGGAIVSLSLFVNNLQRLFRLNTGEDEFVTAMMEAEKLDIPVRLGDAPQNDTLNNIKGIISPDILDPRKIIEGSLFLTFSALGLLPDKSYVPLSSRIPAPLLKASQWLSIPGAYFDDPSMIQILIPIFAASIFTTTLGALYIGGLTESTIESVAAISDASVSVPLALLPIQATTQALISYITALLHNQISLNGDIQSFIEGSSWFSYLEAIWKSVDQENFFNNLSNFISVLLIIRMSKLIGNDRDSIIAEKVQAAAKEFPGQDIVVVIGMLHCNGVARWLLSGFNPLEFGTSSETDQIESSGEL